MRSIVAAVLHVIAEGPGTWFCHFCGAPFGDEGGLWAHIAGCSQNPANKPK